MNSYGLKDNVLSFIIDAAQNHAMDKVVLFGSRARGNFSEKSDIDLALWGSNIRSFEANLDELCPTLLAFDFIDCNRYIDDNLADKISTEGVVLYG